MSKNKILQVYCVNKHADPDFSVVLLHGYGATGKDLVGLGGMFPDNKKDESKKVNWYFLEAPFSPPELAAFGGRAWFNLSLQNFMSSMSNEAFEAFYTEDNNDFNQSVEMIEETLFDLDIKSPALIGGFSQGAMMASHSFFKNTDIFKGLILFSGVPYLYKKWNKPSDSEKLVFLSHGRQDQVLPFQCGLDLEQKLKDNGVAKVVTHHFNGGHEIPHDVLSSLKKNLNKAF